MCRLIEDKQSELISKYGDYSFELFKMAVNNEEKKKMRNMFSKDRIEISKNCRSSLRKYFNKSKFNATKLYKLFLSTISDFDIYEYPYLNELKKETMKNIKSNSYDFEDLASLIYIKRVISPDKDYEKIRHVVIDEAQDLGEFNFLFIKKYIVITTFSIFGDLVQSIYDYRGINSWEDVNNSMFKNNGNIINFNKGYRTTAEIMNVADDVAESIGLGRSDLVVRHGEEVNISETEEEKNIPEFIAKKIIEYKEKEYKTIAVISKTDLLSNYINDDLSALRINIPNVSENDDLSDEKFRICTISNQLEKDLSLML